MRVLEQVVFAVLRDNRWRTCTDVAFAAGLPEIRTQEALEALLEQGRIQQFIRNQRNEYYLYCLPWHRRERQLL